MKALKSTLLTIFIIFVLSIVLFIWIGNSALKKINTNEINTYNLDISNKINSEIKNIAFFGLDSRNKDNKGRSDSIMIATLNPNTKKVKLTSIMRDIAVDIDGYSREKINHAYAYGGPELAIKTLNKTFDLNISDYVTVDFYDLANIIDLIGGVEINLKTDEIEEINKNLSEINNLENLKNKTDYIYESGLKTLNGRQAVAYSRIRKVGNGDYERTERQKKVLEQIFNKIQENNSIKALEIVTDMFKYVETSLSNTEIISLISECLGLGDFTIEQHRIPIDNTFKSQMTNGMWVIEIDLEKNIENLHNWIEN